MANSAEDDILVYIESYNRLTGEVLLDFLDSNELGSFSLAINIPSSVGEPSMVYISNYFLRVIRENTIYTLSKEVVRSLAERGLLIADAEGSFIIGYRLLLDDSVDGLFGKSVSFSQLLQDWTWQFKSSFFPEMGDSSLIPSSINKPAHFTVRNVGQGNWNEFMLTEELKLFMI